MKQSGELEIGGIEHHFSYIPRPRGLDKVSARHGGLGFTAGKILVVLLHRFAFFSIFGFDGAG